MVVTIGNHWCLVWREVVDTSVCSGSLEEVGIISLYLTHDTTLCHMTL